MITCSPKPISLFVLLLLHELQKLSSWPYSTVKLSSLSLRIYLWVVLSAVLDSVLFSIIDRSKYRGINTNKS